MKNWIEQVDINTFLKEGRYVSIIYGCLKYWIFFEAQYGVRYVQDRAKEVLE